MREEYIIALVMFGILIIGEIITKNDKKWSAVLLLAAAVAGSLAAGMGIRFREIVEGPFGFLDAALSVCAAGVFTGMLYRTGFLEKILEKILKVRSGALKAVLIMFFIALPGAFSGLGSLCLLTSGKLVGERLKKAGVPDGKIAGIVIAGSFFGMMLPPNCLPAIIAANGAGSVLPTPYVGFFVPLLVLTLPSLLVFALCNVKTLNLEGSEKESGKLPVLETAVFVLVVLAVLTEGFLTSFVYIGGNTLAFFIGALILLFAKGGSVGAAADSLRDVVVPVGLMFLLGSFIEVTSMTGIRGIYSLLTLPQTTGGQTSLVMLVLMACAVVIGFFLSVPIPAFLVTYAVFPIGWLANPVIVTGISAAAGFAYLFAVRGGLFTETVKALELKDVRWSKSLQGMIVPALLMAALAVVMVLFGDPLDFLIM